MGGARHEDDRRRRTSRGRWVRGPLNGVLRWLLPRLVSILSYAIFRTCRIVFVDREHEDRFVTHGRHIIFAGLHEGMMMLPYTSATAPAAW
jgi:hypothetical protein